MAHAERVMTANVGCASNHREVSRTIRCSCTGGVPTLLQVNQPRRVLLTKQIYYHEIWVLTLQSTSPCVIRQPSNPPSMMFVRSPAFRACMSTHCGLHPQARRLLSPASPTLSYHFLQHRPRRLDDRDLLGGCATGTTANGPVFLQTSGRCKRVCWNRCDHEDRAF